MVAVGWGLDEDSRLDSPFGFAKNALSRVCVWMQIHPAVSSRQDGSES